MIAYRNLLLASVAAALLAPGLAAADTYTLFDFSGAINGGNANVKAPFSGNGFTQSDPLSGHFVMDNALIPGAGTGLRNVQINSFPDAAGISPANAFSITIDSLTLTAGDNLDTLLPLQVQYNNGVFNGFVFNGDFQFAGSYYLLGIQGKVISVKLLDGVADAFNPHGEIVPLTSSKINAHINGLTGNGTPFTPTAPGGGGNGGVPEPASWALMLVGFAGLGGALRARRAQRRAVTA